MLLGEDAVPCAELSSEAEVALASTPEVVESEDAAADPDSAAEDMDVVRWAVDASEFVEVREEDVSWVVDGTSAEDVYELVISVVVSEVWLVKETDGVDRVVVDKASTLDVKDVSELVPELPEDGDAPVPTTPFCRRCAPSSDAAEEVTNGKMRPVNNIER